MLARQMFTVQDMAFIDSIDNWFQRTSTSNQSLKPDYIIITNAIIFVLIGANHCISKDRVNRPRTLYFHCCRNYCYTCIKNPINLIIQYFVWAYDSFWWPFKLMHPVVFPYYSYMCLQWFDSWSLSCRLPRPPPPPPHTHIHCNPLQIETI